MSYQAKKYKEYLEAMHLIGCKHVSTPRQIKNGTRVFRLPFKDAYGYDIDFATYDSGYVRKLVKYGYCPCYQINKREKIDGGFMKITTGPHAGLYRKRYDHSKCVLIDGIGDRIEYLFDFIMRNYFVAKPKFQPQLNVDSLNRMAKYVFGEPLGFDSCDSHTQNAILKRLQE
mgnify:FL=1